MLAAKNGHKDVVLILTQRGANLNLVDAVSVHVHILFYKVLVSLFETYTCYYKNSFVL